jgi:hypothetical protein
VKKILNIIKKKKYKNNENISINYFSEILIFKKLEKFKYINYFRKNNLYYKKYKFINSLIFFHKFLEIFLLVF